MPEDLQEDYADFAVRSGNPKEDGWRAYARGLIERLASAEVSIGELCSQVVRIIASKQDLIEQVRVLSAPVSDEEWKAQGFKGNQEHWRSTFDDLLAARVSASRKEEPNA